MIVIAFNFLNYADLKKSKLEIFKPIFNFIIAKQKFEGFLRSYNVIFAIFISINSKKREIH